MQLLVIRHAIAEDRDAFAASGRDDSERPLTESGRDKMRRVARGLRELVPRIDVRDGSKGPLVMAPGYGNAARAFALDTVPKSFAQYLAENDYDVWLFDYRASPDLPSSYSHALIGGGDTWTAA
jgi:pimeloyl-ACP methyl ester carboxylesterase